MYLSKEIFNQWANKMLYHPNNPEDRLRELQWGFVHSVVYTNVFY